MAEQLIGDIHHASLIVSDTGRALDFYRGVLGLEVVEERPDLGYPGAWLKVGEYQIHLLELPNPDPVQGRPKHGGRDRHLARIKEDKGVRALYVLHCNLSSKIVEQQNAKKAAIFSVGCSRSGGSTRQQPVSELF